MVFANQGVVVPAVSVAGACMHVRAVYSHEATMLAYMGNRYPRTLPQSFYLMSYRAYLSELYTCLRTCSWSIRPNPGFFVQCTAAIVQVALQDKPCEDVAE